MLTFSLTVISGKAMIPFRQQKKMKNLQRKKEIDFNEKRIAT